MAKSAAAQRRDARAMAEGYSSYSQKYRAERKGMTAGQYQAAVSARRSGAIARAATRLSFARATRAGDVFAAEFLGQASAQWAAISRRKGTATMVVDMAYGRGVVKPGGLYGYSMDYLRAQVRKLGSWVAVVRQLLEWAIEQSYHDDADDDTLDVLDGAIVTVTVRR